MREPCAVENPYPGARFRFLAANVIMPDGTTLFPAYGIKRFGEGASAVSVGVIGLTLKETPSLVTPSGIAGLTFGDEAEAINRAVADLEQQGVDAIVVSIHQGWQTQVGYNDKSCGGVAGPLIDILKRVDPRVDLVLSGHTHRAYVCDFAKLDPERTFLVTSAGYGGSLLTDITMTIDPTAGRVVSLTADNRVVQSVGTDREGNPVAPNPRYAQRTPNPEVTAYVARYVEAAREASERPVGRVSGPAEKGGSTEESALGNLIADAQLFATREAGAEVAFMNTGGIRGPLVPRGDGTVTYGAIYSIQPFGNTLMTKTFTGAQLLALLEQQFDGEGFVQTFSASEGFAMTFDLRRPIGRRVVAASLNGQPIDPARSYRVTMNSFLATGGDSFTMFNEGTDATTGPVDLDGFEAYLTAVPVRQLPALGRITELK
ncbi:bifunctional metallophosphatase/5'-nucleotidase [Leptolyngbya sp. 15MV]|nr:bifunctional metallophosphatase/5'-nucleotidase [Leptolyngbya sp. 15MV]